MDTKVESNLMIGPDDKVPAGEATLLGLQHVLAMDVYVPPIILAGMLSMGALDSQGLDLFSGRDRDDFTNGSLYEDADVARAILCAPGRRGWNCLGRWGLGGPRDGDLDWRPGRWLLSHGVVRVDGGLSKDH